MKNIWLYIAILFALTLTITGCEQPIEVKDDTAIAEGEEETPIEEKSITYWTEDRSKLRVVVSIPPQKYFVEKIGGDSIQVISMLEDTDEFLTSTPTPEKIAALAEADVFFTLGAPFETQINMPSTVKSIDIRNNLKLKPYASHAEFLNGVKNHKQDPFFWLSPTKVVQSSSAIYLALRDMAAGDKEQIRTNYTRMVRDLNSLEGDVHRVLLNSIGMTVYTDYPALGYFAETFEIKQSIFDSNGGGNINKLARSAIKENVHTIFFGPYLASGVKENLEDIINGKVAALNPLIEDYPANLLQIAAAIKNGSQKAF